MLTLQEIRDEGPIQTPTGTDLFYTYKADGTPAPYTLNELTAFLQNTALDPWIAQVVNGCRVFLSTIADTNNVPHISGEKVNFDEVEYIEGFTQADGVITVLAGSTYIEVTAGIETTGTTPRLEITKNGVPVGSSVGAGGFANLNIGKIPVNTNDVIRLIAYSATAIKKTGNTFLSVHTVGRL